MKAVPPPIYSSATFLNIKSNTSSTEQTFLTQTPSEPFSAVTKSYVDSHSGNPSLPAKAIQFNSDPAGTMSGSADLIFDDITKTIELNGSIVLSGPSPKIIGLSTPIFGSEAANKSYVDSVVGSVPGLPLNSVQFNSSGTFAGNSNLTFDGNVLSIGSLVNSTSTSTGAVVISGGMGVDKDVHIGGTCYADDYLTTSDRNLKSDIQLVNRDLLNKVMDLDAFSYKLRNSDSLKYGFIAQDLENIGLENFVQNVDGTKKINYLYFIPLILEILKEHSQKIKSGPPRNVKRLSRRNNF